MYIICLDDTLGYLPILETCTPVGLKTNLIFPPIFPTPASMYHLVDKMCQHALLNNNWPPRDNPILVILASYVTSMVIELNFTPPY